MADIQVIHPPNGGKAFWSDLSKKTGTWTAVAALVVVVAEQAENWLSADQTFQAGWHHVVAVLAAASIRAIVGLVQGKIGDPAKASFQKAPDPDDDLGD